MTPGTAVTVGTTYAVTVKADVAGTLKAFVSATPANDTNGGVAWWFSKRYHAGGFVARGIVTSTPADYTKDTAHNLSGNVFIGEVYPVPTTSSLSPSSSAVGASTLTLTVNGGGFFAASVVNWAGSARTTTYVSATQLTASIPSSDLISAGTAAVTVTTPVPGGGTSGAQTFTINNLVPTTSSISPTSATLGVSALTLTVNGTNFLNGGSSTVNWAGSARTTTYVSSTQLTAAITTGDLGGTAGGNYSITVTNTSPGGGTSGAQTFSVNNPVPTTSSISPISANAGDSALTLTVNGTNFVSTSTVNWAGSARTTTYVSATKLTAAINTSDLTTANTFAITVTNDTPGGGTSGSQTFTVNNLVPTTSSISPTSAALGASALTLTVNGTNFVSTSTVNWAGSARTTTYVSATKVTAAITSGDLGGTVGGTYNVTVTNPTPGGGTSGAQVFSVNNPSPTTSSISPTSAALGASALTLTVNGTNFVSTSSVNWAGSARTTTYVSSTQLTAAITTGDLGGTAGGTYNITVVNPTPSGGTSGAQVFSVNNPSPTTSSISPTSAALGASALTLTVNGTNFVSTSSVNWAGSARTTTYVSSTQLTAAITTGDLGGTAGGTYNITVTNPTPNGGTSGAQVFSVNNPSPTTSSISPTSAALGASALTLTVNGTNFVSTSTVNWAGSGRTTTYVSTTQLTAAITTGDLGGTAGGTYSVTVTNPTPSGGTSGGQTFTVNNPSPTTSSISPTSAALGASALTLTVNGTNFVSTSSVNWAGSARTTTYVSTTKLTAAITTGDLGGTAGGTYNVTVVNPTPSGGTSGAQVFSVNNPSPTTSSINPTSATAGDAALTLTVNGTNFVSTSTVNWAGSGRTTTYVSTTKLTAAITTIDLATAGSYSVTVTNPTPSGGTSGGQTFTVNAPNYVTGATNAFRLSAGTGCTIVNGGAQCWGDNNYGQLGNNSTTHSYAPVQVLGLNSGVQAVAVGRYHACAIVNGGVQCWGKGNVGGVEGMLGNNSTADSHVPVQVVGLTSGAQAIESHAMSTCAIVNGSVKCWGYQSSGGGLGNNSVNGTTVPVQVQGLTAGVQAIAVEYDYACAIVNGGAQCWGDNGYGKFGNNSVTSSKVPVQAFGGGTGFQSISAGAYSVCAVVNGSVQCAGNNSYGMLGNNSTSDSQVPVQVYGLTAGVRGIAAGQSFACAIVNGGEHCWGYGGNYALGNNSTAESHVPVQVQGLTSGVQVLAAGTYYTCAGALVNGVVKTWGNDSCTNDSQVATQVTGLTKGLLSFASGAYHNCAVVNGGVQCWGGNTRGQLGTNSTTTSLLPVTVVGLTTGAQAVSAYERQTCAIVNGGAQCWGRNLYGQLGNNTTVDSSVPAQVLGLTAGVQVISMGANAACAVVNGGAQCWGYNGTGTLGNNTTTDSLIPVQVSGLTSGVSSLAVGDYTACAIVNGSSYCWGGNEYGQIGYGTTGGTRLTPLSVGTSLTATQLIGSGNYFSCGIMNGGAQCWGLNDSGQLGNNSASNSNLPVAVYGLGSGVQTIALGNESEACALVNGAVQCWGAQNGGDLGNNSTVAQSLVPVQVTGITAGALSVGVGYAHACAMVNGGVQCWGANPDGRLGNNTTTDSSVPVTVFQFQ